MIYTIVLIAVIAISLFATFAALTQRYKRCPSDKLLVVYGKTGKNAAGEISTAKVSHGGGQFIWPVIQDYAFLDLKPIALDVNLKNALSKQNIRIDVPSTFTVAISAEEGVRQNAAERLLGLERADIASLAQDIIFGQMRLVIATMDIEEINADRDKFLTNIQSNLEDELQKIGLKLINVNVTDITDASGYINALGKNAAAEAINAAAISVAEKEREGKIGVANAQKQQRVAVAAAQAEAEVGEANADQDRRTKIAAATATAEIGEANAAQTKRSAVASANAKAIEGENAAAAEIANTNAIRKVAEAEANKKALTAEKVKAAEALQDSYAAEKLAEEKRAEKDKATQYANTVVPAEIAKQKRIVEAEAEAESIRRVAKGEADAKFLEMEAQAKGINEILVKQAEGFKAIVEAAGSAEKAAQLMIADKLPEILKIQVEAIKNIKIDKITVWDNGGSNGNGQTSTANFMNGMFSMLPPLKSVFDQVGAELPGFMQGSAEKSANEIAGAAKATKAINKKNETGLTEI
jgi:flotillin